MMETHHVENVENWELDLSFLTQQVFGPRYHLVVAFRTRPVTASCHTRAGPASSKFLKRKCLVTIKKELKKTRNNSSKKDK